MPPSLNATSDVKLITLILGTVVILTLTNVIKLNTEDKDKDLTVTGRSLKENSGNSNTNYSKQFDPTHVAQADGVGVGVGIGAHNENNGENYSNYQYQHQLELESEIRESKIVKHDDYHLNNLHYRLPTNLVPFQYHLKLRPVIPSIPTESPSLLLRESLTESASGVEDTDTDNENENDNDNKPLKNLANNGLNNLKKEDPFQLFTAPGTVIISFDCLQRTNKIILNLQNILVDEGRIQVLNYKGKEDWNYDEINSNIEKTEFRITSFEYDNIQEFFTIILKDELEAGSKYVVNIPFTATLLRQDSVGAFSNTYIDQVTNTTRYMVGTKFQATHARRAFPCFDEPDMKAVFYISLARRGEYHTLSNAPLNYTTIDTEYPEWFWDHYEPTLKMSTYLVCFAVSDFASQAADTELLTNGRAVQVWAPRHFIYKGGGIFAADWTARVIGYLENYFNMTDCLPKVDSIMVPQFTTSAMENWGLITYKEHMLIYVPNENTEYRRSLVSTVVAHELSHHWFGNLVTCRWWSDVWLNEGFATYLSYMVLEDLRPELDAHHEFINDVLELSMRSDPKLTTDPVRNTARNQAEIDNAFSRTSYRKGASIVHMMRHFLGPAVLRKGLQNFVQKHAYNTVTQDDLFEELNSVGQSVLPSGVTVKQIMDTWTLKSGYPMVRVKAIDEGAIKISQEPFRLATLDREIVDGDDGGNSWWVPVKITASNSSINYASTWIPLNSTSVIYNEGINTTEWIVVNPEFAGYYLVLYDPHLTKLIKNQLDQDPTVFSPVTRSQLLFSYICSAHANYIRKETALEMLTYLGKETEFIVWNTVFPFIGELSRRLLGSTEYHNTLINFMVPRIESVLNSSEVGLYPDLSRVDKEKPTTMFFRTELISLACQLDSIVCMNDQSFYHRLMTTGPNAHVLTTHVEEMMLCALVKSGGESLWEFALEKYTNETQDYVQWWYMKALTCTYSPELIQRTLDVLSNPSLHSFPNNRPAGLHHLAGNKYAIRLTFNYLLENFGVNASLVTPEVFASTILSLSNFIHRQEDIIKLKKFVSANRESLTKELASLSQSLTTMEENMVWMEFHGKTYATWFLQHTKASSNSTNLYSNSTL